TPLSASHRKPMTCSSVKRFFTSNLLPVGNWTPNRGATQNRGDVGALIEEEGDSLRDGDDDSDGVTCSVAWVA
ncbi:hypothetical protein M3O51_21730, partial [Xanthomonas nasturtii]|nr:hypothetical protein [Xanthomonas nasturtii]